MKLSEYISSSSRNKLVFLKENVLNLKFLDVGKSFSSKILSQSEDPRLSLKSKIILDKLLLDSMNVDDVHGKYLALSNIGILFEPELKIDIINLFDTYSKGNILFVKWEGETENTNLYFTKKQNGIKIELNNISHIIL